MRLVIIESPYAGDVETNLIYLRSCLADSLARGEAPFASHAIYTQPGVLDDSKPEERAKGMEAGFAWGSRADAVAVYVDLGITHGMERGVEVAQSHGLPVVYRNLVGWSRSRAKPGGR